MLTPRHCDPEHHIFAFSQDNKILRYIICFLKASSASLQIQPASPALQAPYADAQHPCNDALCFQCQPSHRSADTPPPYEESRMDQCQSPVTVYSVITLP